MAYLKAIENIKDKNVLVTGGTGSLGQELVKSLLTYGARSIRVFSRGEYEQVMMSGAIKDPKVRYQIGDVRDKDRLSRAMNGVDFVIHTAALKHVPVCEYNPIEAVKTNIDGALNVIDCAIDNKVSKVLAISSDKAVHPINLYGATKLVAEKLFTQANVYGDTKFSSARFGNFYGSRGSVLQLWAQQRTTGTLTVTDKEMSRFWITLPEAADFCITCLERMQGSEIFIPLMPTHTMEEMAGNIAPECKLQIIGKRKGEKLNELLISEDEADRVTRDKDCLVVRP
jgi:FlaA1/EpsC-like NDP-sugar epimerase